MASWDGGTLAVALNVLLIQSDHSKLIATASLGMLFVRSLERSTAIHNAMLARGFNGRLPRLSPASWRVTDTGALISGLAAIAALRWSL